MKYCKIILISIFIFFFCISKSQSIENQNLNQQNFNSIKDKLHWGGNLSIAFGSYTAIQVAPTLSYSITEKLIGGIGVNYTYFEDKQTPGFRYKGTIWAPRVFGEYFIKDFFLHAEYQQIYYKDVYTTSFAPQKWQTESKTYAGGGYRSWMGAKSYMFIMLLFDLQSQYFSLGTNPFLQVGFSAGF